jgi:hypothetical protein
MKMLPAGTAHLQIDAARTIAMGAREMAARRCTAHPPDSLTTAVSHIWLRSAGRWSVAARPAALLRRQGEARTLVSWGAQSRPRTKLPRSWRRFSSAAQQSPAREPADRTAVLRHLEPLRLRYLTIEQLRAVFDALALQEEAAAAEKASGEGTAPRFGTAGAEALLRDLAATRAATERPSDLISNGADVISADEVLMALDRDGDGWVTWEDFDGVIGKAAEKVDSRVFTVAGSLMFNFTAQGAAMPTIPLIARQLGCSTADIGFITSASALSRLICNMPCAWLAEKVGRRPLLVAGPAIGAASITMFGMSSSYEQLIMWNAVFGIGSATTAAASTLYLNDVATPRNRSRTTAPTTITALLGA